MGITVHNHRYPIFFAVFQHDGIILHCILTVTVRVHGVVVQFQDFTVFSGSLYKRLIIDIVSSVIRMSDDIDTRILHSIKIGLRILLPAAWSDAWNMKTCNDHVQLLQGFLLKIYRSRRIQDIHLRTQKQLDPIHFTGYYLYILKIKLMTGSRHFRCMLCDPQEFKTFIGSSPGHLAKCAVCMSAGYGVCVKIHY